MTHEGVAGTCFAVWAPNAERVSVIGDFNGWDGRRHPMRAARQLRHLGAVHPGLGEGTLYKYEIKTKDGRPAAEDRSPGLLLPRCAPRRRRSSGTSTSTPGATPTGWPQRAKTDLLHEPMAIYEVHLGSWMRVPETNGYLTYRDLAHRLADLCQAAGLHPHRAAARSPSTRSTPRGATRSPATLRRPAASARRTTSSTSWTTCTRTASA